MPQWLEKLRAASQPGSLWRCPRWHGRAVPSAAGDAALHPKTPKNGSISPCKPQKRRQSTGVTLRTLSFPSQPPNPRTFSVSPFRKGSSSFSVAWKLYRATDSIPPAATGCERGPPGAAWGSLPHGTGLWGTGQAHGAAGGQETALMSAPHRGETASATRDAACRRARLPRCATQRCCPNVEGPARAVYWHLWDFGRKSDGDGPGAWVEDVGEACESGWGRL